jgi:hypothetical protein
MMRVSWRGWCARVVALDSEVALFYDAANVRRAFASRAEGAE